MLRRLFAARLAASSLGDLSPRQPNPYTSRPHAPLLRAVNYRGVPIPGGIITPLHGVAASLRCCTSTVPPFRISAASFRPS